MQLRRQHRIAYQTRIRLKMAERDDSVVARVQNLSPHGVFVTASDLPEAGTEVLCRLDLGGQHRTVRGRVAWVRRASAATPDKSPGAGIEFLDLDDKDAELLNRVVEPDPRDSKPVDVWFEGMAAPIRCQAAVLGEGVRLATRLPFLRLNSTVRVSFGPNGGGNEEGTLDAVVLEPSSEDGVPRLQLNVSLLGRDPVGAPPEIDLDGDPELQNAPEAAASGEARSESEAAPSVPVTDVGTLTAFPYPSAPLPPPPPVLAEAAPPDPASAQLLGAEEVGSDLSNGAAHAHTIADDDDTAGAAELGAEAEASSEEAAAPSDDPDAPIEAPVEGSSPLVSHMVRLGPPPLPALRHRRQSPEADKTPTVSDTSSPTTIPPMSLSSPLSMPPRRRVNGWGLGAVVLVAVIAVVAIGAQRRRNASSASAPPPAAGAGSVAGGGTAAAPEVKPPAPTITPMPTPVALPAATGEAKKGMLLVETYAGINSYSLPLVGSTKGKRRKLLTQPPGVALTLPHARPKADPGVYRPAGDRVAVEVQRKGSGSEVHFLYDPNTNDATMKIDAKKVTLQLAPKKP